MATEDLLFAIPQELIGKFSWVLIVVQAVGWAIIVYIIFSIINSILNRRRTIVIEQINNQLLEIKDILRQGLSRRN